MSKVLADQHTRSAPHPQKHAPQEATHAWHALHVCKQASLVRHPSFSVDNTHTHTQPWRLCTFKKQEDHLLARARARGAARRQGSYMHPWGVVGGWGGQPRPWPCSKALCGRPGAPTSESTPSPFLTKTRTSLSSNRPSLFTSRAASTFSWILEEWRVMKPVAWRPCRRGLCGHVWRGNLGPIHRGGLQGRKSFRPCTSRHLHTPHTPGTRQKSAPE